MLADADRIALQGGIKDDIGNYVDSLGAYTYRKGVQWH
jgi:hypothetical protein